MSNIITAIDIGSSQIKGLVAEERKDGLLSVISVFKVPSAGIRRGIIVDPPDFVNALKEVMLDLQKISKKCAKNIFVNVNSEQIKARPSRGIAAVARADREIQQDDIDRVIQASRAVKLMPNFIVLHNIIREYFVDDVGDIQDPLHMTGSRLEVGTLIIEAFSPQIDLQVKSFTKAGAEIGGLIFSPLSATRAVLSKRQKELGVVMIDFGFGTTSFAVYEENKILYAKSFPIGAGYLTNDIAIGLKTSIDIAEKLKLTYGFARASDISRRDFIKLAEFDASSRNEVTRRFLSEIIEIRLAELLELVNNELKVLGKNSRLPAGVVITGGGVKLAGLSELVRQELKLSVQIGFPDLSPFEIMNPAHKEMLDDPEFAAAIGLALWVRDQDRKPLNGVGVFKRFVKSFFP